VDGDAARDEPETSARLMGKKSRKGGKGGGGGVGGAKGSGAKGGGFKAQEAHFDNNAKPMLTPQLLASVAPAANGAVDDVLSTAAEIASTVASDVGEPAEYATTEDVVAAAYEVAPAGGAPTEAERAAAIAAEAEVAAAAAAALEEEEKARAQAERQAAEAAKKAAAVAEAAAAEAAAAQAAAAEAAAKAEAAAAAKAARPGKSGTSWIDKDASTEQVIEAVDEALAQARETLAAAGGAEEAAPLAAGGRVASAVSLIEGVPYRPARVAEAVEAALLKQNPSAIVTSLEAALTKAEAVLAERQKASAAEGATAAGEAVAAGGRVSALACRRRLAGFAGVAQARVSRNRRAAPRRRARRVRATRFSSLAWWRRRRWRRWSSCVDAEVLLGRRGQRRA